MIRACDSILKMMRTGYHSQIHILLRTMMPPNNLSFIKRLQNDIIVLCDQDQTRKATPRPILFIYWSKMRGKREEHKPQLMS